MPQADDDTALDEIAAELYALTPDAFTAARNARAGMAPRAIAARVKGLRKPSVAAWAVDLLVRAGQLAEAIELSAALREAQDDLDAAELAALGRQRRQLVAALASEAVRLADAEGVAVSAAARDEVEKTINAAVVDAAAAAAVLTGRLARTLDPGDLDEAVLVEAVGGTLPGATVSPPRDDLADRRARKAAEKAAREADRAASEAERELARIDARRQKAQERLDHLTERIDDLQTELERFRTEASGVEEDLSGIEGERTAAATAATTARAAADKAARARAALGE